MDYEVVLLGRFKLGEGELIPGHLAYFCPLK